MRTPFSVGLASVALASLASGCPAPQKEGRYPARAEGCDVKVFPDTPAIPIDNIGPVTSTCGEDVSNDDCMRTLKDQTCKLGGDVVWGVSDVPSVSMGKKHLAGRAAHTRQGRTGQ